MARRKGQGTPVTGSDQRPGAIFVAADGNTWTEAVENLDDALPDIDFPISDTRIRDIGKCEENEMSQMEDLAKAHQWASYLMDDENQDRVMILEGLLEMIADVTEGKPVDVAYYTRMYTR